MQAEFLFNHHSSIEYNIVCGYFDMPSGNVSGGVQTNLSTESNYDGSSFYIINNNYSEAINFELSIVRNHCSDGITFFSQREIRAIVTWLCNPIDYCDFQIKDDLYNNIIYRAKFTKPQYHTMGDKVVGMTFTCTFERPYGLSEPRRYNFALDSSNSRFKTFNGSDETTKCLYPKTVIIRVVEAGEVSLHNLAEDNHTATTFTDCITNEIITMDCEHRRITSTNNDNPILSRFNKHWVRFVSGENEFETNGDFEIEIEYQEARKVGAW